MKITSIKTIPIEHMRIIQLETDEGITGLGEAARDCHSEAVSVLVEKMGVSDAMNIEQFWQQGYCQTFWRGGPIWTSAVSAVEQALWDITGKKLGVPVSQLVGGKVRDKVKMYTHFGGRTPEECAQSALSIVGRGYKAIKTDPFGNAYQTMSAQEMRETFQRVKATREAVGDDIDILIETHGRLNTTTAIQAGLMLEEFKPFFYEEPVGPDNLEEMAKVAESVNIPIATGERLYTRWGFRELLERQIADYIQPDLCHAGGFWEVRKIAIMAEVYHIRVIPHNPNGPISTVIGLHFGACTPNFEMLESILYNAEYWQAILKKPPELEDGWMRVPTGPGWGIELNEEGIVKLQSKR
ncbi:galactonate dehydratase [Candidatus Poribacteria bacterium]|nr:galactonate dehydratase [Candidatus Poribacteria bacterium]